MAQPGTCNENPQSGANGRSQATQRDHRLANKEKTRRNFYTDNMKTNRNKDDHFEKLSQCHLYSHIDIYVNNFEKFELTSGKKTL